MDEGEIAAQIAKFERDAEEATRRVEALEAEKAVVAKQLEDTKVAQIKAEAVRDANSEVILMLKKELESTKDELREMKSNSVSEKEFTAMQSELDRAWEAAAELQTMWDNDRKVIEFLTKSIDDEKVKKEARQGLNIPVAAKGLLSWARTTISKRANDVSVVSQQTLETVSQAYQELEASTGEFSDDVISDDSESDFMRDM
jgi:chromosome segregation ATPase